METSELVAILERPLSAVRASLPAEGCVTHLSKSQAEDLLDWLEAHHCRDLRLTCDAEGGFAVHFRAPKTTD